MRNIWVLGFGAPYIRGLAVFYFLHNIMNPYLTIKDDTYTLIMCRSCFVYIQLLMSQSIADDVTNALHDATIVTQAREKQ